MSWGTTAPPASSRRWTVAVRSLRSRATSLTRSSRSRTGAPARDHAQVRRGDRHHAQGGTRRGRGAGPDRGRAPTWRVHVSPGPDRGGAHPEGRRDAVVQGLLRLPVVALHLDRPRGGPVSYTHLRAHE